MNLMVKLRSTFKLCSDRRYPTAGHHGTGPVHGSLAVPKLLATGGGFNGKKRMAHQKQTDQSMSPIKR
jgi:hypothetical protein